MAKALSIEVGNRINVLTNTIDGTANAVDLVVVGVFITGEEDYDNTTIKIPLGEASRLLNTKRIEFLSLGLDSYKSWTNVENFINKTYKNLQAYAFYELDDEASNNGMKFIKTQNTIVLVVVLILVTIGIMNSVIISVHERFSELGNLKANGESNKDILLLLILEGIIIGALSSVIGIFLGFFINSVFLHNGIVAPPPPNLNIPLKIFLEYSSNMIFLPVIVGCISACIAIIIGFFKTTKLSIIKLLNYI